MTITTTTHLNFRGDARAALEFYRSVFGGHIAITTYGDVGMPADVPGSSDVLFGAVTADSGFRIMAYDILGVSGAAEQAARITRRENGMTITDQPFFVSISAETLDEISFHWNLLAERADIVEPLAVSAWSPGFGMLTDRFGVTWSFSVVPAGEKA